MKKEILLFASLTLLLLSLGCIQQGWWPPTIQPPVTLKVTVRPSAPSSIIIGETAEYSLEIKNGYPKNIDDVEAYISSPDVTVSIQDPYLQIGTIPAGDTTTITAQFSLLSSARENKSYSIVGKLKFNYLQEASYEFVLANKSEYATGITPRSYVEDGPLTITMSGIKDVITTTSFKPTLTIKNELNGFVSSSNVSVTPDSTLTELVIKISKELITGFSAKIKMKEVNATLQDNFYVLQVTDPSLLKLEANRLDVYLTINVRPEKLTQPTAFRDEILLSVKYGYVINIPTITFTAIGAA
ncbi:MAG: hypothetical protein QW507_00575 [Candidatus Nanoarchaeia archaeon]|nr:hypothetical protein [Candidatus Haiyanarchaeum thermophilum]MCW1303602.1 hypothetical protein [Candidatus Haiyanarchaeum thermophilum]MCW1306284.1 hypothetical protein [Candidatus Haiyanarchaeum thermophilum]MCW1307206.1 hypothetical protein [Candidatus Haiyanarchaeum thermophilum]MCW1307877.1 hypothetical protein [Candidatus Haiyanarchaeum thermophilum]